MNRILDAIHERDEATAHVTHVAAIAEPRMGQGEYRLSYEGD